MDPFVPLHEAGGSPTKGEEGEDGEKSRFDVGEDNEKDGANTSSCSVDNSRTVINKIANLYAERLMSDVCLVVGNVSVVMGLLVLYCLM